MDSILKKALLLMALLCIAPSAWALDAAKQYKHGWFGSLQAGYTWAFGDDSWNVFNDWREAKGASASLSVGKDLSPLWSARLKARYLELKNRVNLEVYDAFHDKYPQYFPDKGFYSYKGLALQGEAMLNLTNLVFKNRSSELFNLYIIAGLGANVMMNYDEIVDKWDGPDSEIKFKIDKGTHFMPAGVLGGMFDFRIDNDLSLNFEVLSTFTGDKMEGVKYEEAYDVYITCSIGATVYF